MNTQYSDNSISIRLDRILNAWDSSKHPRDSKGRFTFVLGIRSGMGKSLIGGDTIGSQTIAAARKALQEFASKSAANKAQVEGERDDIDYYQHIGYKSINDELRSGGTLEDTMCIYLNDACRFSSDEPLTVMRGESSYTNNWAGVKAGDSIPEGLSRAFISTSTDKNVADHFASKERSADPNGKSKIYETNITFTVPTTQRFGIPNAYGDGLSKNESEIILPNGTKGKVTSITEKEVKIGNRTVVQQFVTVEII